MPWCPSCRQEYVESAVRCADCGTTLVADLSAADAAAAGAARTRAQLPVRLVASEPELAAIEPWLAQAHVPSRRAADGAALEIPAAWADRVADALEASAEIERGEGVIRVLGPRADREPGLPEDPAILERSLDELAGDRGLLPRLLAVFQSPSPRARRLALERLRGLEGRGTVVLADALLWLVRERHRGALFGLLAEIADDAPRGLALRVSAEFSRLDARSLPLALHVLQRIPAREVAPSVLALLRHDDPEVRAEADEVLMSIFGVDQQFDAEGEPRAREQAIQRWRDWIAQSPNP